MAVSVGVQTVAGRLLPRFDAGEDPIEAADRHLTQRLLGADHRVRSGETIRRRSMSIGTGELQTAPDW